MEPAISLMAAVTTALWREDTSALEILDSLRYVSWLTSAAMGCSNHITKSLVTMAMTLVVVITVALNRVGAARTLLVSALTVIRSVGMESSTQL